MKPHIQRRLPLLLVLAALPAPAPSQDRAPPAPASEPTRSVLEKVWVPPTTQKVWIEPIYVTIEDGGGKSHRVEVQPGQFKTVQVPGYWQTVERQLAVEPVVVTQFSLRNEQQFQVQLQGIVVGLEGGRTASIALPWDRVISSEKSLNFDLPPGATQVTVQFKEFDWCNRRFVFPIRSHTFDLSRGPVGVLRDLSPRAVTARD